MSKAGLQTLSNIFSVPVCPRTVRNRCFVPIVLLLADLLIRPSLVPLMNLWDYKGHPARQLERSQYRWSRLENDKEASI
jgi:hypothetical protein